ncbi:MAG: aspartate aminotransferase family protein [Planctomycetota bacterium]
MSVPTTNKSAELYERACHVLPGGVSRNTVLRKPHPAYVDYGKGCRVVDIEGVERIDFANNMASLIHGHAHPEVIEAVTKQLQRGTAFTLATEVEVEYAELLCGRNNAFEKLRFVNSGTEAVMGCLKASRAFTGRPKIAKVEGAYHGAYDYAEVSQAPKPETWGDASRPTSVPLAHGTPASALGDVIIVPYNNPDLAREILDEHKDEIACVLIDPMSHRVGLRPAEEPFVDAMRQWTTDNGALLVFDEVITFRSEFGGAQDWYPNSAPDLTALGKAIGGGFPVGAIVGRADVVDVMNPLAAKVLFPHSGTFSANPVTVTAGLVSMRLFDRDAVQRVNSLTKRAMQGIEAAIERTGATACVTGGGSMFRVHMKSAPPSDYRAAFLDAGESARLSTLLDHLFDSGFLMINTCSGTVSTAMGEAEIDSLVSAIEIGLSKITG